jgi:hypothetical protein
MITPKFLLSIGFVLATTSLFAQGCIVGRQCTPGAADGGDFLMPKERQYGLTYRTFRASDHYIGTQLQTSRRNLNNYVINRQNIWDIIVTQGATPRTNITLDIPFLNNGWSVPRPVGSAVQTPGPRVQEKASGVGDISVVYKTWLKDPEANPDRNIVLGIGIKAPTGRAGVTNILPNDAGKDPQPRPVDQSIQLGDGGWGIPLSLETYKKVKQATFFFTTNYLLSPRDTNGVSSGFAPTTPSPSIGVLSVPDQFLYRLGVGGKITSVPGLSASLSWRKEGVPQKDIIGGSHGFRRPGFSTSIEPSVSYSKSGTSYTISLPMTRTRNSGNLSTDGIEVAGSPATFAKNQFIFNISKRVSL